MTEKQKRKNLPYNEPVEGWEIRYSPVNLAYTVFHYGELKGVKNDRTEAVAWINDQRRGG